MKDEKVIDGSLGNGSTVDLADISGMKSVKEVCELLNITRKTLFYYDKIGLLKPTVRDGKQKHKYYNQAALRKLYVIRELREMGLTIDEIQDFFGASIPERKAILEVVKERDEEELKRLQISIRKLKKFIEKDADLETLDWGGK